MDERSKGLIPTTDKHSRLVIDRSVENEMETSYLQYSMSVIVARALPMSATDSSRCIAASFT